MACLYLEARGTLGETTEKGFMSPTLSYIGSDGQRVRESTRTNDMEAAKRLLKDREGRAARGEVLLLGANSTGDRGPPISLGAAVHDSLPVR